MKVSTFVIIALLCAVAYLLGTRQNKPAPAPDVSEATPTSTTQKQKAAAPATPVLKVSQIVKDMMEANPGLTAEAAQRSLDEKLNTYERWELHARVIKQLPSGHLALMGYACKPGDRTRPRDTTVTFALWGFPGAEKIAEEAQIDCLCVPMAWVQSGSIKMTEMIYVDPAGKVVPKRPLY